MRVCMILCSLQQWFEYCATSKKHTCPVCKQGCKVKDACRLYFQSVGDANEGVLTQKQRGVEEDAGVLRKEVKRLEGKVSGLNSVLENQTKELGELKDEVFYDLFCLISRLLFENDKFGVKNAQVSGFVLKGN